ncbi:MAG: hypothetical protein A3C03_01690 [Candidatus Colwellbacteria bacterium RIFCSPHIGHO2_02_FULL_45_17]|nr:MAG: hypothetical protein A3C03_01690 [Candidatus Colwellbacteria bacterium RIFCSPHIGHO2_02_FULL_45_17]
MNMRKWLSQKRVWAQLLIAAGGLFVATLVFFFNAVRSLPDPGEIADIQVSQSTKIYDREGEALLYEIYAEEKRTIISSDDIPDLVREATISIEDDSFYEHPAFDWRGVARAVVVNLIRGRVVQGGSTITQQLAKNTFLTNERTISRKIKELVLAVRLEKEYTKDEILDLYLNQVPYGHNAYGIEAASRIFFEKSAKDLTLNEIAVLAALPQSPSYYSPWGSHVDELEKRKNLVLRRMRELDYIDDVELESALEVMPEIADQPETGISAPHFVIHIQDYLRDKYGEDALRIDGLKVITTLDRELQEIAEDAVLTNVERNSELYGGENGALVAIDPQTGQILAMVGSKDYFGDPVPEGCTPGTNCRFEGNFNVATQGLRQPGSAIKPFVYLTAMQQGFTPDTVIWDVPTEFSVSCPGIVNFSNRNPACYHPQNYSQTFSGPVVMKEALARSINVPAVQTLYLAGLNNTIETVSKLGITTLNDPSRLGLSLVLGGGEVRLVELTGAYAALAADGVYRKPVSVLRVENAAGEVLEEYKDDGVQAVDPREVRIINDILSSVELRSGLFSASLPLTQVPGHQVALKTGTTNDYVDAWAFGYTPNLAVGVWAGNNNRDSLTSRGSSILAAVPMWHSFASKALAGKPLSTFERPVPIVSSNPVLNGKLIEGSLHTILYYLGRRDDPQFPNWETGVQSWLQTNSVDRRKFELVDESSIENPPAEGKIEIEPISPENGSFVSGPVDARFRIISEKDISSIEVYLNGELVGQTSDVPHRDFTYGVEIDQGLLVLQNSIVVRVTDEDGLRGEESIIVFK